MPAAQPIKPSDMLTSASDELGDAIAAVRGQALDASGDDRKTLLTQYRKLIEKQQRVMMLDLKAIDKDPAIVATLDRLGTLTQQIAKARREMATAKSAIDRATKVLGFIDQILAIVGKLIL